MEWLYPYVRLEDFMFVVKQLEEDNKRLREWVDAGQKLVEDLISKNKKLESDLEECECSMHYENDEVWFWKRECKKLKKELSKYKKQYEHSMWEDDELIYEEWLYD